MLRRIKTEVENELTEKVRIDRLDFQKQNEHDLIFFQVEVLMYCPLTIRQKLLYMGLKKKIRIEELLQGW